MRAFLLLLLLGVAFGVDTPPSITLGTGAAPIPAGLPPTGAAGGDLGGTYPNPTVTAARFSTPGAIGNTVASTGAFTTLLGSTSITNSALTATRVVYSGTAGLQADDSGLTYNSSANLLTVNHNGSALPSIPAADDTVVQVGGKDATTVRVLIDGFGAGPSFSGRVASGTNGSKTASASGLNLVGLAGFGYDGSAYSTTGKGSINIATSELWSGSGNGTKIFFNLTPIGSTTVGTYYTLTPILATQTCGDAATNSSTIAYTINHQTTGTAAVGFGSIFQMQGHDDGGTMRFMSQMSTSWTDAASATRSSKTVFNISVNAASTAALILAPTIATFQCSDAATNTATTVANFTHTTSGTAATSFGTAIQISGYDDGNTQRAMTTLTSQWTTATSATRSSKFVISVQVAGTVTAGFTLASTSATFAAGFPVTFSDSTASSSTTTGAVIVTGGIGCAKNITVAGTTGASFKAGATANGSVAVALTALGPTGAQTTVQGWLLINLGGTDRYIPCF